MRIRFTAAGGVAYFPGLDRALTLDAADLPPGHQATLARLLGRAGAPAPCPGPPDRRTYTITVEEGDRSNTIELDDPVGDPAVSALLDELTSRLRARPGRADG